MSLLCNGTMGRMTFILFDCAPIFSMYTRLQHLTSCSYLIAIQSINIIIKQCCNIWHDRRPCRCWCSCSSINQLNTVLLVYIRLMFIVYMVYEGLEGQRNFLWGLGYVQHSIHRLERKGYWSYLVTVLIRESVDGDLAGSYGFANVNNSGCLVSWYDGRVILISQLLV